MADGSGYVPVTQLRARPGLHPDDLDYHHVAPIEAWDRDYTRWRYNTTRVQRRFMMSAWRLAVVPQGLDVVWQELIIVPLCLTPLVRGGAYKSLARPGRKKATATKLGIYSTYSPRSSIHFLARCSNFCKPIKKKFRRLSVQPGLRGSNDLRVGRKTATFNFFSVQGRGGSPTGPHSENRVGDQDTGSPGRSYDIGK